MFNKLDALISVFSTLNNEKNAIIYGLHQVAQKKNYLNYLCNLMKAIDYETSFFHYLKLESEIKTVRQLRVFVYNIYEEMEVWKWKYGNEEIEVWKWAALLSHRNIIIIQGWM